MPALKRNSVIIVPETISPLPVNSITTPVQEKLPDHIEKLIGKVESDAPLFNATPKVKNNRDGLTKFKIRPRVLYEEVNKVSKIVESKKLAESPKHKSWSKPLSRMVDYDNNIVSQPVSLKSRRQIYMQSRFSEKRQQRQQFELKRRAMSHDQMLFHFRDIIVDNILNSEFH